jgi:hypothetical protein
MSQTNTIPSPPPVPQQLNNRVSAVASPGPTNDIGRISDTKREELLNSLQSNGSTPQKLKEEEFIIENYAGCSIEQLVLQIQKRKKETKQLEQLLQTKREENNLCVVCLEETRNTVCVPCGHLAYCNTCVEGLKRKGYSSCGLCRETVSTYTRVFFV